MSKIHRMNAARLSYALTAAGLAWLAGVPAAHAHISIIEGGTHEARSTDDGLKDAPCGITGSKRGTKVYNYKPGTTINVSVMETISHPGYFRVAFDSDGDNDFVIPSGTSGAKGSCGSDAKCGPGKEDFCNSPTVLLDNLDEHAGAFGTQKKYTWSVKLPDMECANCTLQIIQVMNDLNIHTAPYPADDIYYQCIDIKLSKDAPDVNTTPVTNNGMTCEQDPPTGGTGGSAGSAGAAGSAGSAGGGGSGGMGGMAGMMTAGAAGMAMPPAAGGSASGAGGSSGTTGAPMMGGAPAMMMTNTGAIGAAGAAAAPPSDDGDSGGCSALPGRQRNPAGWSLLIAAAVMALAGRRKRRSRCTETTPTRARR